MDIFGQYNTVLFNDLFPSYQEFLDSYNNIGIKTTISQENARTLYYLLYAKHGNQPITHFDKEQWKYLLFSIVFQYGPTWEKKMEIQETLRNLTDDEIRTGAKSIVNHALNPGTTPTTDELSYISEQNTQKYSKSKVDAYGELWVLLQSDVTGNFLKQFEKLFVMVLAPQQPRLYENEV